MAIDPDKHQQIKDAAEERLRARYNSGRDYLSPTHVMSAVRSAALGLGVTAEADPHDVPAEDLLAALTLLDEARRDLDSLERDLIQQARERRASWQAVADHLGLEKRQSAESRYLRLQRGAQGNDRYVDRHRLDRARQRTADAWCREHQHRIGDIAQRLADLVPQAWPHVTKDVVGADSLRALAAGPDPVTAVEEMRSLKYLLAPYGIEPPHPAGDRAAEAAAVREEMLALLEERVAVRAAVTTARPSADR
ncbi:hypothetical protein [Streptomyces achromogenes]|uniref:hypothetical protein n=1 Tax=Streptomyces achromogenes TaxID=67255 RepID=UPI00342CEE0B